MVGLGEIVGRARDNVRMHHRHSVALEAAKQVLIYSFHPPSLAPILARVDLRRTAILLMVMSADLANSVRKF